MGSDEISLLKYLHSFMTPSLEVTQGLIDLSKNVLKASTSFFSLLLLLLRSFMLLIAQTHNFINKIYQEMDTGIRKRYNYNVEFAEPVLPKWEKQLASAHRNERVRNYRVKELPYRNCVERYKNAYHIMLKTELKMYSRNLYYLNKENDDKLVNGLQRKKQPQQLKQSDNSQINQCKKGKQFEKIHTISEHCEDDEFSIEYVEVE